MDKIKQILSSVFTERIIKRLKSFAWRFASVSLVAGLSWASKNLGMLEIPVAYQGVIGLILGEVTKYLNTKK